MKELPTAILKNDEKTIIIDSEKTVKVPENCYVCDEHGHGFIETRRYGNFVDKAFYLDSRYNWVLAEDKDGCTMLIPLRR